MWVGLLVSRCATNKTAIQNSKLGIQGKSKTATTQVATSQVADTNFILKVKIAQSNHHTMPIFISNQCPYGNSQAWSEGKIVKALSKAFQLVQVTFTCGKKFHGAELCLIA